MIRTYSHENSEKKIDWELTNFNYYLIAKSFIKFELSKIKNTEKCNNYGKTSSESQEKELQHIAR